MNHLNNECASSSITSFESTCTQNCWHVANLEAQVKQLLETKTQLTQQLQEKDAIIESLTGILKNQQKERFDKKSEKVIYLDDKIKAGKKSQNGQTSKTGQDSTLDKPAVKKRNVTPHGRKLPDNLPEETVVHELTSEMSICPICGLKYRETNLTEDSSEIDVQIKIVRKKHKRKIYCQSCNCDSQPQMMVAPKPANIIYKSMFTTQLWTLLLVLKYYAQIPLYRQVNNIWSQYGGVCQDSCPKNPKNS